MAGHFEVKHPLPRRRAHQALRDQLIEYLLRERPNVGDRFLSDHQLVVASKLSRPTVRRALDELARDGWIERRHGRGTFVGPRLALPVYRHVSAGQAGGGSGAAAASGGAGAALRSGGNGDGHRSAASTTAAASGDGKSPAAATAGAATAAASVAVARVAVLVHFPRSRPFDWQSAGVLDGMDEVAASHRVALELLGSRDGGAEGIIQRLNANRPDALVAVSPRAEQSFILAEARRLGTHVLITGSRLLGLGLPTIREDGAQGARLAVEHLLARGHRRIGFAQLALPVHWAFERREGYLAGLRDAGIPIDENLVCWADPSDPARAAAQVLEHVRRQRPSALLLGSGELLIALRPAVECGELVLPRDVSVVTFDQMWGVETWGGSGPPTHVALPLQETGRRLVTLVRRLIDGGPGSSALDPIAPLPCTLVEGTTVADAREPLPASQPTALSAGTMPAAPRPQA